MAPSLTTLIASINHTKTLEQELTLLIHLTDHLIKSANKANLYRSECLYLARLAHELCDIIRLTSSLSAIYHRPIYRIATVASTNLRQGLTLVRKCKHSGLLQHVFSAFTSFVSEFENVSHLLVSSIDDFRWLLSIFNDDSVEGGKVTIPPVASNDPTIALVWNSIASLQAKRRKHDRIEAANYLASLARSNSRYRKVIVEEGAVLPLLQLLKGTGGCSDGQVEAALALCLLAENIFVNNNEGISIIVEVLGESDVTVQIVVAELVAKIVEVDEVARDEFARENVVEFLFSCLIYDFDTKEYDKQQENKHKLKTNFALALWRLCENSLLNCQKIAEPKNLFRLAKIVEREKGELRLNCLKTIMEVAVVAEKNVEFRKAIWKRSSPHINAVIDQLLRVIKEINPEFLIPAIKAIGCLARIFPAKETVIVGALLEKLGSEYLSVVSEAVIGLMKFTCPDNPNCVEHSRTIIEFNGVPVLKKLLSDCEGVKLDGVVLLCYLSINIPNSEALAEARVLNALESEINSGIARNNHLRDMIYRAMNRLVLYQDGPYPSSLDFALL